jgi:hypothetical protein
MSDRGEREHVAIEVGRVDNVLVAVLGTRRASRHAVAPEMREHRCVVDLEASDKLS